jgi:dGTPase
MLLFMDLPHFRVQEIRGLYTLYEFLYSLYAGEKTCSYITTMTSRHPIIVAMFVEWRVKYSNANNDERVLRKYENMVVYDLRDDTQFVRSILVFISGMGDQFAVKCFYDLMRF